MGWKLLLDILWLAGQNNGFTNVSTKASNMISFSNGRLLTKTQHTYNFKCFEGDKVDTDINTDANITPEGIKIIKRFLFDEFRLDGEKK